jgi:hypothetical protein
VRIEGHDRQGLERLLRYCARPAFARERIERIDDERILYHLPKRTPDGRTRLTLTSREFISRLAALIPAPRPTATATMACWRPMRGCGRV